MRILALLTLVSAFGLTAPALGQEPAQPVVAAEFADDFPALLPMRATAHDDAGSTASGALGPDERALIAAAYWLLLGGVALRRVTRRSPDDSTPVSSWDFGHAPPVPR